VKQYNPYDSVAALEERVAEYGGSKYAVAVDSCTNAILISLVYRFHCDYENEFKWGRTVSIPKKTYVGVAHAVINAGGVCEFRDEDWQGEYEMGGVDIIDAARRFRRGMYNGHSGKLYCVSAHWGKIFKIGRGGFILTDSEHAKRELTYLRFDGRMQGVAPKDDDFDTPGYHCYMLPEEASRGLMLFSYMPDDNDDIPTDDYADLSFYDIFKEAR